ncbi:hypothetical protein [Halovivax gelatinilyticus]|uniref:hypothetical protein n=1 Tax=Halovivax gelatinilyticus TaxID=2961597 RepID=UPI0020CA4FC2|nr:hypothetical protein [Halovivax gelatinilyticus]
MATLSRRRVLGAVATGTAVGLAGCSDGDDADGPGEEATQQFDGSGEVGFESWLAADVVGEIDSGGAIYMDVPAILDRWPETAIETLQLEQLGTDLRLDEDAIDELIVVEADDDAIDSAMVVTGSFDRDRLVDTFAQGTVETPETYGEYAVLFDGIAISDETIVMSDRYESFVDADRGDGDRLTDVDEGWRRAASGVGGAELAGVIVDPDESYERLAISLSADGEELALEIFVHYADAETARAEKDEAEQEAEDEFVDEAGEIHEIRVVENVVVVEATVTDVDW